jgi:hypothetical protein
MAHRRQPSSAILHCQVCLYPGGCVCPIPVVSYLFCVLCSVFCVLYSVFKVKVPLLVLLEFLLTVSKTQNGIQEPTAGH